MTSLQLTFNFKKHIWSAPLDYRDLSEAKEVNSQLDALLDLVS